MTNNLSIKRYNHGFNVPQSIINKGPKAGPRFYLDALYSSLIHFKPKLCLEIGTHTGNSTQVFQKYFDEYMNDGLLITCDIKQYVDLSHHKNVRFVQVHPHMDNMAGIHYLTNDELLVKTENNWDGCSFISNLRLILNAVDNGKLFKSAKIFDFVFIDGDHQMESAKADIIIANLSLKPNHPMLLDDTDEFEHDCAKLFHEEIKPTKQTYEFEDWDVTAGCAIII